MLEQKVINKNATRLAGLLIGVKNTIIIPAVVLMEVLYLFKKNRIKIDLIQTQDPLKRKNYQFEPLSL